MIISKIKKSKLYFDGFSSNKDEIDYFSRSIAREMRLQKGIVLHAYPEELVDLVIKYENNRYGISPLLAAIRDCDERAVRIFLEHGADPNTKESCQQGSYANPLFALDYAATFGTPDIVNMLIDNGAQLSHEEIINGEVQKWTSAVFFSAVHNRLNNLKVLITRGADLSEEFSSLGGTLLHASAIYGAVDVVKYLISLGMNPDMISNNNTTPIGAVFSGWSFDNGGKFDAVKALLEGGAKASTKIDGSTYLHFIVNSKINNPWVIKDADNLAKLLISKGANVNAVDSIGHTPLYYLKQQFVKQNEEIMKLISVFEDNGGTLK